MLKSTPLEVLYADMASRPLAGGPIRVAMVGVGSGNLVQYIAFRLEASHSCSQHRDGQVSSPSDTDMG